LKNAVELLAQGLVVSCQAEDGVPLNKPEHLAAMAATVVLGGAKGVRASAPENIHAIRNAVQVPIIGIYKKEYPGFEVLITPTFREVAQIVAAGADIVALDATARPRPAGMDIAALIRQIKEHFNIPIMADVATFEEGIDAAKMGADLIATTLSGYTSYSPHQKQPDLALVRQLSSRLHVPVVAEGRLTTSQDIGAAMRAGAYAVVVGSMITRPHLITRRFASAIPSRPAYEQHIVAVDIGGTKIAAAIVNQAGHILHHKQVWTARDRAGPIILQQVIDLIALVQKGLPKTAPVAIGIASGGQISRRGEIVGATAMISDWVGQPLQHAVSQAFNLPTTVINDGQAAALGEARLGIGRSFPSSLCVVIGTGLGGGLVVNGHMQRGAHGLAGSIGQLRIGFEGKPATPLEERVSGPGLLRAYNAVAARKANTGAEVGQRALTGDLVAQRMVQEMGTWLGLGLSHALHTCDAGCVVVGGALSHLGDLLLDSARSSLARHGHQSVARTPILAAALGVNAALIGAAIYAQQQDNFNGESVR
jgi:N-acetylmannosamine-6-phosphate 2-epimerase / N-acetylmannosamine kinase